MYNRCYQPQRPHNIFCLCFTLLFRSKDCVVYVGGSVWALDWCPRVCHRPEYRAKNEVLSPSDEALVAGEGRGGGFPLSVHADIRMNHIIAGNLFSPLAVELL